MTPTPEVFETIGQKADKVDKPQDEDAGEGDNSVEEIESLCMNCGENVSIVFLVLGYVSSLDLLLTQNVNRVPLGSFSRQYPTSAKLS